MESFYLIAGALAAYIGTALQCSHAMHDVARAIELDGDVPDDPNHAEALFRGVKLMFRKPARRWSADRDKALMHAQGWVWVNAAVAITLMLEIVKVLPEWAQNPELPLVGAAATIAATVSMAGVPE